MTPPSPRVASPGDSLAMDLPRPVPDGVPPGVALARGRALAWTAMDWTAAGASVLGAALLVWLFHGLRHDDAYITFRYARNLGSGLGYVFNPGERILGSTTPLLTLLLALVQWLSAGRMPLEPAAITLGAAGVGAQAVFLYLLLRRTVPLTATFACLVTVLGGFGSSANLALETNVFAALLLGTIWALAEGRTTTCGLLLGLAFLCRYDAFLLVPLVAGWAWWRERRLALRELSLALAIVLPWIAFATAYFGTPLPHTLSAKTHLSSFGAYIHHYLPILIGRLPLRTWLAALAVATGAVFVLARTIGLASLVLFAAGQLLAYAWIGAPPTQHWHMYVPILTATLLGILGTLGWLESSGLRLRHALVVGIAAPLLMLVVLRLAADVSYAREGFWLGGRQLRYETVSRWMRQHVRAHQVFLATEVGTLGYLSGDRMIDPFGLVTATNDWPRSHTFDSYLRLVEHYRPDLVLVDRPELALALERDAPPYRIVKVFPWARPWAESSQGSIRTMDEAPMGSTLCIRDPDVLRRPAELPQLLAGVESYFRNP